MANLTSSLILTLIDRVTGPARGVQASLRGITDRVERNNRAVAAARGDFLGMAAGAVALGASLAAPVRAAMRFEEALADVTKVADFTVPGSYEEFTQGLRDLSREVPIAVDGLAEIAAAGAQGGIATEDLLKYTRAAAQIGVAFDIGAGEAGDALASLMAGLGLTLDEAILLSDGMNHLSNAQNSSAAAILDVQLRVGALGEQFGFANAEVSALASAMVSGGFAPERVATAIANMGYALTAGTNATTGQKEAFEALGMTAEQVNRDMQRDATGTSLAVMEALAALPAELRSQTAVALFGREADALIPLLGNLDLLRESLGLVAEESSYAGSAFKEFLNRNRTFAMRFQRFKNVLTDLSIVIGQALIPSLSLTMDRIQPILELLIDWIEANGDLVATVARVTAALVGLRVATAALRIIGLTGRGGYLSLLSSGLSAAAAAGAAISSPAWLAIAAAAAAIAAVGLAVYDNWDRVEATLRGVAAGINEALSPAFAALEPVIRAVETYAPSVAAAFSGLADPIANTRREIESIVGWVRGKFDQNLLTPAEVQAISDRARNLTVQIINWFASLPARLYKAGWNALQSLWEGMAARGEAMVAEAAALANRIADAIIGPVADAMERGYGGPAPAPATEPGVASDAMGGVTGFAKGGAFRPGSPIMVGERGRELIFPNRAGYVATAQQTRRILDAAQRMTSAVPRPPVARSAIPAPVPPSASGGSARSSSGAQTVNFYITVNEARSMSAEDLAQDLGRRVQVALDSTFGVV